MARQDNFARDQHAYIPQAARAAMERQMQRGVPAHLQQYMGPNRPAYVPQRAQAELTNYMQKAMPEHLKQYAGAYVQQSVVTPGLQSNAPQTAASRRAPAPMPDKLRMEHSGAVGTEQHNAQFLNLFQADAAAGSGQPAVLPPGATPPPAGEQSQYDFIMNPQQPKRPGFFAGTGTLGRVLLVVVGLFVLLVLFIGAKNLLAGSNLSVPDMVAVAQDQQEIIHLATNGYQNVDTSDLKNFSVTTELSVTSEQQDLLNYLKTYGHKVSDKQLNLKVSQATDDQLTSAQAASTFDSTYTSIMQNQLTTYQAALKTAFASTKGPKGRALLSQQYTDAGLLLKQLGQ